MKISLEGKNLRGRTHLQPTQTSTPRQFPRNCMLSSWVCFAFGKEHNLYYLTYIFFFLALLRLSEYLDYIGVKGFVLVPIELLVVYL